jgi:Predicted protease
MKWMGRIAAVAAMMWTGMHAAAGADIEPSPTPIVDFQPEQTGVLFGLPPGSGYGQTVGIIGWAAQGELGIDLEDLKGWFLFHQLPIPSFTVVLVAGQTNTDPSGELLMDGRIIGTYVPEAKIRYYLTVGSGEGIAEAIGQAVADGCDVLSCSFGAAQGPWEHWWADEDVELINTALKEAGEAGVTVCIASGDSGGGRVAFPAASPYALAVGGVMVPKSSGLLQVFWNYPPDPATAHFPWLASGGGVLPGPVPWWQAKVRPLSFPINGVRRTGRGVPDVAAMAMGNNGWMGTSACAPFWAALIARINAELGRNVGFINPIIYSIGPGSPAFHDITVGNNIPPSEFFPSYGYEAGPGWDACTGWGAPNGIELLNMFRRAFFGPNPTIDVRRRQRLGARGQRLRLRGTASGEFEVVSISVEADGRAIRTSGSPNAWTAVIRLRRGGNRIHLQAVDVAGKRSDLRTVVVRRR